MHVSLYVCFLFKMEYQSSMYCTMSIFIFFIPVVFKWRDGGLLCDKRKEMKVKFARFTQSTEKKI